jgi:tetratricopeptide (TPR) repeat protein
MIFLRAIILSVFSILVIVFAFVFFTFDTDYQLEKALNAFLKGEHDKALVTLEKVSYELRPSEQALYRSYISKEQDDYAKAYEEIKAALVEGKKQNNTPYLLEIHLNKACIEFLLFDDKAFSDTIQEIITLAPNNHFAQLFLGLKYYLDEEYGQALTMWSNLPPTRYSSEWMKLSFSHSFSPTWLSLRKAHCHIEEEEYLIGRKILEKHIPLNSSEEEVEKAFLMGLSYAKEAEQKPLIAAMPYYQLAQSYFDKVPVHHKKFWREKKHILKQLNKAALSFINLKKLEHIPFFVDILEHWKASQELNIISQNLVALLHEEISNESWDNVEELATILSQVLQKGHIRDALNKEFEDAIYSLLDKNDISQLSRHWNIALLLSYNPNDLRKDIGETLAKNILTIITSDSKDLPLSLPHINFWNTVEVNSQKRFLFAKQLVLISGTLWMQKGQEEKAKKLMNVAESLPFMAEKQQIRDAIIKELQNVHIIATKDDDIIKLSHIYDAADDFNFTSFKLEEKNEVSNQLEDAAYLIKIGRTQEAQKRLEWILKITPSNSQARSLLGQIHFKHHNYAKVLETLIPLDDKDTEIQEIIALSQISLGSREKGKHDLEILSQQDILSDTSYLQLAYLELSNNAPAKSLQWLSSMKAQSGESLAYSCVAAFLLREWNEVLDTSHELPKPYSNALPLKFMAFQSFLNINNDDMAEKILLEVLQDPSFHQELYPSRFISLITPLIELPDLPSVAMSFYKNDRQDYKKALTYFNQISSPSYDKLLDKAEIFIHLKKYNQAEKILREIEQQEEFPALHPTAQLLLGQLNEDRYTFHEALTWYKKFLSYNDNRQYHMRVVKLLQEMLQWEDAYSYLFNIASKRNLSYDEEIEYIRCLTFTSRFDKAKEQAKALIKHKEALTPLHKIHLAEAMLISHNNEIFTMLMDNIENISLKEKEKHSLIKLYVSMGEYSQAQKVTSTLKDAITDGDALLSQARLNMYLNNKEKALDLARYAFETSPYNYSLSIFLLYNDEDLKAQKQYASRFYQDFENTPSHALAELGMLRHEIAMIQQEKSRGTVSEIEYSQRLYDMQATLQSLADRNHSFPEVFALLGKVLLLSENRESSEHALLLAIQDYPSYTEAHKALASLYTSLDKPYKAIDHIAKALRFSYNDAESWIQLSILFLETDNRERSSKALEKARRFTPADSSLAEQLDALSDRLLLPQQEDISQEEKTDSGDILSALREMVPAL